LGPHTFTLFTPFCFRFHTFALFTLTLTAHLTLCHPPFLSFSSVSFFSFVPLFALPLTVHPTHPSTVARLSFLWSTPTPPTCQQPTSLSLPFLSHLFDLYSTLTSRLSFQTLYVFSKGLPCVSSSTTSSEPQPLHSPKSLQASTAPCLD
ncbi:MAG: hypothetical protein J3Q66DRAFT_315044, partial [Benniella sp.]